MQRHEIAQTIFDLTLSHLEIKTKIKRQSFPVVLWPKGQCMLEVHRIFCAACEDEVHLF